MTGAGARGGPRVQNTEPACSIHAQPIHIPDMMPSEDIRQANGLLFHVCRKDKRWHRVSDDLDIVSAFNVIGEHRDAELGIFVSTPSGGLLYWSSRDASLFNSVVIGQAFRLRSHEDAL